MYAFREIRKRLNERNENANAYLHDLYRGIHLLAVEIKRFGVVVCIHILIHVNRRINFGLFHGYALLLSPANMEKDGLAVENETSMENNNNDNHNDDNDINSKEEACVLVGQVLRRSSISRLVCFSSLAKVLCALCSVLLHLIIVFTMQFVSHFRVILKARSLLVHCTLYESTTCTDTHRQRYTHADTHIRSS